MAGIIKNGIIYSSNTTNIKDNVVGKDILWSSDCIMKKLASIKDIIKVDSKPTISNSIITYVKNGTSHTTTDSETWFYYVVDGELYKTIFIDGEEFTKADSNVNFNDLVEKSSIVTTLNENSTNEQILGALSLYKLIGNTNGEYIKNGDLYEWASRQKSTSTCFCNSTVANLPTNSDVDIILFNNGGGIKSMICITHDSVYTNHYNTVQWSGWLKIYGKKWYSVDIDIDVNLNAWGNVSGIISEGIGSEKIIFYDDKNNTFTSALENIGTQNTELYVNGFGENDNYNFSLRLSYNFENGKYFIVSQREMLESGNPPHFSKFYFYK